MGKKTRTKVRWMNVDSEEAEEFDSGNGMTSPGSSSESGKNPIRWSGSIPPRFERKGANTVLYDGEICETEDLPNGFTKIRSKNLDVLFRRDYYATKPEKINRFPETESLSETFRERDSKEQLGKKDEQDEDQDEDQDETKDNKEEDKENERSERETVSKTLNGSSSPFYPASYGAYQTNGYLGPSLYLYSPSTNTMIPCEVIPVIAPSHEPVYGSHLNGNTHGYVHPLESISQYILSFNQNYSVPFYQTHHPYTQSNNNNNSHNNNNHYNSHNHHHNINSHHINLYNSNNNNNNNINHVHNIQNNNSNHIITSSSISNSISSVYRPSSDGGSLLSSSCESSSFSPPEPSVYNSSWIPPESKDERIKEEALSLIPGLHSSSPSKKIQKKKRKKRGGAKDPLVQNLDSKAEDLHCVSHISSCDIPLDSKDEPIAQSGFNEQSEWRESLRRKSRKSRKINYPSPLPFESKEEEEDNDEDEEEEENEENSNKEEKFNHEDEKKDSSLNLESSPQSSEQPSESSDSSSTILQFQISEDSSLSSSSPPSSILPSQIQTLESSQEPEKQVLCPNSESNDSENPSSKKSKQKKKRFGKTLSNSEKQTPTIKPVLIQDGTLEIGGLRIIKRASEILDGHQIDEAVRKGHLDTLFISQIGSGIGEGPLTTGRPIFRKYIPPDRSEEIKKMVISSGSKNMDLILD